MASVPAWELPPEPIVTSAVNAWNEVCVWVLYVIILGCFLVGCCLGTPNKSDRAQCHTTHTLTGRQAPSHVHCARHLHEHVYKG